MADQKIMRQTSPPPVPRRRSRHYSNPDVFSDEYALDTFDHSSPSPTQDSETIEASTPSRSIRTSLASDRIPQSRLEPLRRGNISSRSENTNPTPSAVRYSQSTASQVDEGSSGSIRRNPSDASTAFISRAQSPYQGTTGPSHPYAMYSQDQDVGISRAPSNTTRSTARTPLQNYSGPSGPSHPYGMYSQNTVSEDDLPNTTLPVQSTSLTGFVPTQSYQRRLGPDGEDADDLIGPDGHTEQLPPYTRYPNDLPPKERNAMPEREPIALRGGLQESQEALTDSPAGYVEDRSPVSQPLASDASPDHGRTSHNLVASGIELSSPSQVNSAQIENNSSMDEGGNFKEVVASKRRKKACGIVPLWLLVVAVIVLLIIVIGGAVGGALRHKHVEREIAAAQGSQPAPATVIITTTLIDAEPVTSTPSDLPTLQTGSFAVPLKDPVHSNACLSNDGHSIAWSCADGPSISLEVIDSGTRLQRVNVSSGLQPGTIRYGAQPPELARPATLSVMNDKNDRGKGPAYFFQQLYDKVVIVKEIDFEYSGSKRSLFRRIEASKSVMERGRGAGSRNNIVEPSDKPWYCIWNDTILEGFLFATQDNDDAIGISAPLAAISTAYGALYSGFTATSASPSLVTSTNTPPSATAGSWLKRQATGLPFPKRVKLEERRTASSPKPYCKQMQILNNGMLVPADPAREEKLDEVEPLQQNRLEYGESSWRRRTPIEAANKNSQERRTVTDYCQCQWVDD